MTTLAERKARGETITDDRGVTLVHGRVLAAEFLAEYDKLLAEHNALYRTVSPFRSEYAEVDKLITADIVDCASNLAYSIKKWHEDARTEQTLRDRAICREAEVREWDE